MSDAKLSSHFARVSILTVRGVHSQAQACADDVAHSMSISACSASHELRTICKNTIQEQVNASHFNEQIRTKLERVECAALVCSSVPAHR